ncbi:hypothetical protein [Niastella populi]|uniref:Uncharacterized protein n=1 Tax=Niastella populi TaxID=550983 RepID=A0A1V9G845_9BACT|nr:hypothetical protein [Niastella populi]OQP66747.1 hypothetical protein A4R26_13330 [Niastella populi]
MRKCILLFFLLLFKVIAFAQSIWPAEASEICPHQDFSNATQSDARTVRFDINFGNLLPAIFILQKMEAQLQKDARLSGTLYQKVSLLKKRHFTLRLKIRQPALLNLR